LDLELRTAETRPIGRIATPERHPPIPPILDFDLGQRMGASDQLGASWRSQNNPQITQITQTMQIKRLGLTRANNRSD